MPSSTRADSTRDRIVDAAKSEFARYGIAGARVDRIAKSAQTSKERIYAYFRSKENLYQVIAAEELAAIAEATRLDPADLPGYAGRVHDYFASHPDNYRLMSWGQLEFSHADAATTGTVHRKTEQLRRAQEAGQLDPAWDPLDVLVFVNQLATSWAAQPDLIPPSTDPQQRQATLAARRAAVIAAVERLFPTHAAEASSP
ncbi:TetR/AcrR family transcriptional regulator [Nocardia nova]|uniref:TetR/AcrR family transcriptional regulator n=1 Tax=Nocardia nova TaxID=37330 RepID=A0A2S6AWF8_9NOCA|nr:TetR family transcriptional regulator [Nocardia nova]PPJ33755.1 TetR/AcrR family transcriptional regulator [Nocardia nova]PPJ39548.1 TetR/AcrR family transcriptional regulator [Nocardia nova]